MPPQQPRRASSTTPGGRSGRGHQGHGGASPHQEGVPTTATAPSSDATRRHLDARRLDAGAERTEGERWEAKIDARRRLRDEPRTASDSRLVQRGKPRSRAAMSCAAGGTSSTRTATLQARGAACKRRHEKTIPRRAYAVSNSWLVQRGEQRCRAATDRGRQYDDEHCHALKTRRAGCQHRCKEASPRRA